MPAQALPFSIRSACHQWVSRWRRQFSCFTIEDGGGWRASYYGVSAV